MLYFDRTDKSETPKCNYCGSATPENGFTVKEVIHRGWDEFTRKQDVAKTKFTVCKGTPCGGYLQMAHEG
jgi:hypothetical protein